MRRPAAFQHLLTDKHFDGGGFTCTVGVNRGLAAHLRDRQAHIHERRIVLRRKLEGRVVHPVDPPYAEFITLSIAPGS